MNKLYGISIAIALAITFSLSAGFLSIGGDEETHPPHAAQAVKQITCQEDPVACTGYDNIWAIGNAAADQQIAVYAYLAALEAERIAQEEAARRVVTYASKSPVYNSSGSNVAECIKQRESGGNYSINTGNGYYGAYQFLPSTWNNTVSSMGRTDLVGVLPSDASPTDQDAVFQYLYGDGSGASHWGYAC